jgi:hypothetical protein
MIILSLTNPIFKRGSMIHESQRTPIKTGIGQVSSLGASIGVTLLKSGCRIRVDSCSQDGGTV